MDAPDPWGRTGSALDLGLPFPFASGAGSLPPQYSWPKGYPAGGMSQEQAATLLMHPLMQQAMATAAASGLPWPGVPQQMPEDRRRGGRGRRDDKGGRRQVREELPPANSVELHRLRNGETLPLRDVTVDVCMDPQGARTVMSSLESADSAAKNALADMVCGDIVRLSLHQHGCRVVQQIFESVSTEKQVQLAAPLRNHVLRLIESPNGNHVIQKVLERMPPETSQFVIEEMQPQLENMAVHGYGCRVVQRILEHCMPDQTGPILDRIMKNLVSLCREQYGNYVVQHVLEHGRPQDRAQVVELVRGQAMELACHKYGSNVVEKSLLQGSAAEKALIIEAIMGQPKDPRRLQIMVQDRFANYVVQRILEHGEPAQKEEAFHMLKDCVPTMKKTSYAKHIRAKMERLEQEFRPGLPLPYNHRGI